MANFQLYNNNGQTLTERSLQLPPYVKIKGIDSPKGYIASQPLTDAVNVALALGQPLLLTGEPGTGKTQLASSIAYQLGVPLLKFYTKTTSTAKDLFYRYDSLRHFHDAQLKEKNNVDTNDYIELNALGQAIINSADMRSVVLIDEIDKAPRDFPNDVLNELENMAFRIRETGKEYQTKEANRPIVLITSNSEKNLPDAFLRRCIFYHIPFPNTALLKQIVNSRVALNETFRNEMLDAAIEHFEDLRAKKLRKKPATAELLSWIHVLNTLNIRPDANVAAEVKQLKMTYTILAKNQDDLEIMRG
ncbi:MAG: MoxR family ATPase [Chitinophagales bacterium]